MTKWWIAALCFCLSVLPISVYGQQNNLTMGYGFGAFNDNSVGKLRNSNGYYHFVQLAYAYEKQLWSPHITFLLEPFLDYVIDPTSGLDAGVGVSFKLYPFNDTMKGLFFVLGTGAAYTTVGFKEQGTHAFFILQGSLGYHWEKFFIENRFRHLSNGGFSHPNYSINANIVSIGMRF